MNFQELKNWFKDQPYFLSKNVIQKGVNPQIALNQLSRWQKNGLIIALKRGIYVFNEMDRGVEIDANFIANICYDPSYVSLESALNYYGIIPERVTDVTSVTTKKTYSFRNQFGNFIYQHVKPVAFRGFRRIKGEQVSFFLADPEKAVVDFLYLNLGKFRRNTRDLLENSYRFQNIEGLDCDKIVFFGNLFKTKKLTRVAADVCDWIKEEKYD